MTQKENLLAMLRGEKPDAVINSWAPFGFMMNPVSLACSPIRPGATLKDAWGVTMSWPADQPGVMPLEGEHTVCPDIDNWKEVLHAPDVANMEFDWAPFLAQQEAIRAEGKLSLTMVPVGNFELMRNLLGYENCLMSLLMDPETMYDIMAYIAEYRMACYKLIVENLHPDILFQHDDWGGKDTMIMSPEIWREIIKPFYKDLYAYLHENGVIVMHHSDSFLEPLIPDMEELGIDIWQGVLPQNDIAKIQSELTTHMLLMGGIDTAVVDFPDTTEEVVRAEVRRALDAYLPGGHYIPAVTGGGPGSINPHIDPIIADEIEKYSQEYFK